MTSTVNKKRINFKRKKMSTGVDMHKRSWRIMALDDGEIVLTACLFQVQP